jgi:EAL domain-containing protein (putative c-di-GMP-specific phosphodiesterase class I)
VLETPFVLEAQELHIAVSIGAAIFPSDGTDADVLLKNADLALYHAKREGRGRVRFFEPAMDAEVRTRRSLERALRRALEGRELTLAYQPQLDLRTDRIVGVEALARWDRPQHGPVPPGEFVPVAEASGLILPLGAFVLGEACRQAVTWQAAGRALRVAVNVSPVQLRHPDGLAAVGGALAVSGLDPALLELEITEGVLMETFGHEVEGLLRGLVGRGVRLAIDDFGTGYSSLAYLKRLPVHRIKVDRSFVRNIGADPEDEAVVRAIVRLGHALGKQVVAEGVENEVQLTFLRELGCDAAQGFLFGQPQAAATIERLLAP